MGLKKNLWIPFVIVGSIILQIIVMENDVLSSFLKTSSVPFINMVELLGFSLIILLVVEIYKIFKRKKRSI